MQRKVVAPNDFTDLAQGRDLLRAFEDRYNATAQPLQWKFTTSDLDDMLARIDRHTTDHPEEPLSESGSCGGEHVAPLNTCDRRHAVSVQIASFSAETASVEDLHAWYEVFADVSRADLPGDPVSPIDHFVKQLCAPPSLLGRKLRWDAREDGQLKGTAEAFLPADENDRCCVVTVRVPARYRRRGLATLLLRTILPDIRQDGCDTIAGEVPTGTDGEKWTAALHFKVVLRLSHHVLDITTADRRQWQVQPAVGFHLRQWIDAVPGDLLEGFARARNAMADQPIGDATFQHPAWTAERVRQYEARTLQSGASLRYVAAIHERSGQVASFTEMSIIAGQNSGNQEDTAVLRQYRGHGLGVAMKASMMRWLTAEFPSIKEVRTMTASDNARMIGVNSSLGYSLHYTEVSMESGVDALEDLLRATR